MISSDSYFRSKLKTLVISVPYGAGVRYTQPYFSNFGQLSSLKELVIKLQPSRDLTKLDREFGKLAPIPSIRTVVMHYDEWGYHNYVEGDETFVMNWFIQTFANISPNAEHVEV